MLEDWFRAREPVSGRRRSDRGRRSLLSPPRILDGLFDFARAVLVIGGTAFGGSALAVRCFAAKGTAQIFPPGVAWVAEKENPAMPASGQARSQARLAFQNRSQEQIILTHKTCRRVRPVPARNESKMPCDLNCKKPKLSLKMLTLLVQRFIKTSTDTAGLGRVSGWLEKPTAPHLPYLTATWN